MFNFFISYTSVVIVDYNKCSTPEIKLLNNLVFRRKPYSVRSGNIVLNRVIKFKLQVGNA